MFLATSENKIVQGIAKHEYQYLKSGPSTLRAHSMRGYSDGLTTKQTLYIADM